MYLILSDDDDDDDDKDVADGGAGDDVMLKIKCDQYWPADSEPVFYGDLQVKIMNETSSSDWHVREMHISLVCICVC